MLEHAGSPAVEICWFFDDGYMDCVGAWLVELVACGPLWVAGLMIIWRLSRTK